MNRNHPHGGKVSNRSQPARLIKELALFRHPDGGYSSLLYRSPENTGDDRPTVSVGYRMLTQDQPVARFHRSPAVTALYFHLGSPLQILTIDSSGVLESSALGADYSGGQSLQLFASENSWKAMELSEGLFSLFSEVRCPESETDSSRQSDGELCAVITPDLQMELRRFFR
jgi:predicted cupin superfamily sugar epimerase